MSVLSAVALLSGCGNRGAGNNGATQEPSASETKTQLPVEWQEALQAFRKTRNPRAIEAWLSDQSREELHANALILAGANDLEKAEVGLLWHRMMAYWAAGDAGDAMLKLLAWSEGNGEGVPVPPIEAYRGWAKGAMLNPAAALELLSQPEASRFGPMVCDTMAEELPGSDYAGAYEYFKKLFGLAQTQWDNADLNTLLYACIHRLSAMALAARDWKEALAFFESLPASRMRTEVIDGILLNVAARSDPEDVFHEMVDDGSRNLTPSQLGWILFSWWKSDREAAWQALDRMDSARRPAVEQALAAAILQQGSDAIHWYLTKRSAAGMDPRTRSLVGRYLVTEDEPAAIAWMRENRLHLDDSFWSYLMPYVSHAPEFSRYYLQEVVQTDADRRHGRTYGRLKTLGREHPEEAITWIHANLSGDQREFGLAEMIREWGSLRPEFSMEVIASMKSENYRAEALGALFELWPQTDPDGALAAAQGLAGEERFRAVAEVCARGIGIYPELGEAFVELLEQSEVTKRNALVVRLRVDEIAAELWRKDSEALLNWLENDVPDPWRHLVAKHSFREVLSLAPESFENLGDRISEASVKDGWLEVCADPLFWGNPKQALVRALQIRDEVVRAPLTKDIARVWANFDREYFLAYLERAPLQEEDRKQFREIANANQ